MIILREERLFGKLDALEAEKLGISVKELRQRRAGFNATGTVHDSINLKTVNTDPNSLIKYGADANATKRGFTTSLARDAQDNALQSFKEAKKVTSNSKNANTIFRGQTADALESASDIVKKDVATAQSLRETKMLGRNNSPTSISSGTTISSPAPSQPKIETSKKVTPPPAQKVMPKSSPGFLTQHGGKLAIGAGIAAGGLLAYQHFKNKD